MHRLTAARVRTRTCWTDACAVGVALMASNFAHAGETDLRAACTSLASLAAPGLKVEAAEWISATRLPAGSAGVPVEVPDHCLLRIMLDARPSGIEDLSYGVGIELRLPA